MVDSGVKHVRVWVPEVWDNLRLPVTDGMTIAELKSAGLERAVRAARADQFSVKYRGGLILNEEKTLAQLGVPDNAPFIILRSRRHPVI